MRLHPIALYLPQYHPIPENDEWWGKGFTEWTNVAKAKPLFKGHYQPHLPADLGFYDLRLPEVRQAQADLAREYGIYGFCYYHYWFNGRRILERPFQEVFESSKPDFPFMLCWANENWTRRWDGLDHAILLEQKYDRDDAYRHIQHLIPYFKDKRYIKVDGKPFFAFYKAELISNLEEYVAIFREEAKRQGLELYLTKFETDKNYNLPPFLDASVEFQPFSQTRDAYAEYFIKQSQRFVKRSLLKLFKIMGFKNLVEKQYKELYKFNYTKYVEFIVRNYKQPIHKRYPGVMPSWDNTARKGKDAILFKESNSEAFKRWINFHNNSFQPFSAEENFIFINAWNEWAEGCHLEPCQRWGVKYLEAVKEVFKNDWHSTRKSKDAFESRRQA